MRVTFVLPGDDAPMLDASMPAPPRVGESVWLEMDGPLSRFQWRVAAVHWPVAKGRDSLECARVVVHLEEGGLADPDATF